MNAGNRLEVKVATVPLCLVQTLIVGFVLVVFKHNG